MSASFTLDTRRFDASLKRFMAGSKKSGLEVLLKQAGLFVRDVASVTPPNQNARFLKGRGVSSVRRDIAKVMRPVKLAPGDPAQIHKRFRKNGEVREDLRGGRPDKRFPVSYGRLKAYTEKKIARVGLLASGWNAAAKKLGTRLPEWITRHGSRFGGVRIGISREGMSVRVENSVPYAGAVYGMKRRLQWALGNRARQMNKILADHAIKRAARAAGLKAQ